MSGAFCVRCGRTKSAVKEGGFAGHCNVWGKDHGSHLYMKDEELIAQLCDDLNGAHDELMRIQQVKNPSEVDWPDWSPQANSIRMAELRLQRKLAKTDLWSHYPDNSQEKGSD